jgi:hypothetical protein
MLRYTYIACLVECQPDGKSSKPWGLESLTQERAEVSISDFSAIRMFTPGCGERCGLRE